MLTRHHKSERGQILILIALALVAVIGFTALAIDVSITYDARRSAQNAADSAAMAGALAYVNGQPVETAAYNAAAVGGFANNGVDNWVVVNHPPLSGEYAGDDEYIQVIIRNQTDPSFLQVVFSGDMTNQVEAIARARPAEGGPIYDGNAIITLKPTGKGTFLMEGITDLKVLGGAIFNNSNHNCAFDNGGGGIQNIDVAGGIFLVGDKQCMGGIVKYTKSTKVYTRVPPITIEDPRVPPPIPPAAPTCSGPGSYDSSTKTYSPGNYTNIDLNGTGDYTFNPGSYCLSGYFKADGILTLNGSNLRFRIDGGDFTTGGIVNFTGSDLLFYNSTKSFVVNGVTNFSGNNVTMFIERDFRYGGVSDLRLTGNSLMFYINSGDFKIDGIHDVRLESPNTLIYLKNGSFNVGGANSLTTTGTTFYLEKGSFTWGGVSGLELNAPTTGPYKGLAIYLPEGNTTKVQIAGVSSTELVGTIMAPSANVSLSGVSGLSSYRSQIICSTLKVDGVSGINIDFRESENWQVPGDPFIELPH